MDLKLTIDVGSLTIGDQVKLEEATKAGDICRWLVAHAGASLDELYALPLRDLQALATTIGEQLKDGFSVSKLNGARS